MECELNGMKIKYDDGDLYWWKTRNGRHYMKVPKWVKHKASIMTTHTGHQYRKVMIGGKKLSYHRVVYFIHRQEWDIHNSCMDNYIDHRDGNTLNNNIDNLRVATHQQNMWNTKSKNYYWSKRLNRYIVRIGFNNKKIEGGAFINEADAIVRAAEMKKEYHTF